jgi:hypothetical protein
MITIIIEVMMVPAIIVAAALVGVALRVGLYWMFLRGGGHHEPNPTQADHDGLTTVRSRATRPRAIMGEQ